MFGAIEIKPHRNAEPVAERIGEKACARGGANKREGRKIQPDRAGGRAFADHDVEGVILHRGIENFLYQGRQSVNFVNEKNVIGFEIGQDRGEVAGLCNDGSRRGSETHTQLF
jgi:hypothetical protein